METERRDEFGGAKRPPLRNRLKACFIRPPGSLLSLHQPSEGGGGGWGMGRWGAPWQNPKLRNSDSDSTWKINKRLKTSFAGTSHKKSFHILVSKDQGRRSSGKGGVAEC